MFSPLRVATSPILSRSCPSPRAVELSPSVVLAALRRHMLGRWLAGGWLIGTGSLYVSRHTMLALLMLTYLVPC